MPILSHDACSWIFSAVRFLSGRHWCVMSAATDRVDAAAKQQRQQAAAVAFNRYEQASYRAAWLAETLALEWYSEGEAYASYRAAVAAADECWRSYLEAAAAV